MLVLTRKIGQKLFINSDIEVIVLGSQQGRVKLGLVAPPGVSIRREEVQLRMQLAEQDADPITAN
jgi:carbon storage regulator